MAGTTYVNVFIGILRWLVPALSAIILYRCFRPLITFRKEPELWGWLNLSDGREIPITHWENVIGRSRLSDIAIDFPTVSRSHAVLTRYDDGSWTITDADSKDGVLVNQKRVRIRALKEGDIISIGGLEMILEPISDKENRHQIPKRTKASNLLYSFSNVVALTVLQLLCCVAYLFACDVDSAQSILLGFGGLMLCQWVLFLFYVCIRRNSFDLETVAFFLCTMGMCVISAVAPDEALKQLISILIGLIFFLVVGWSLRDLERAKQFRYVAAVVGILFLLITLLFGREYYGAKNWVVIGSMSMQLSELTKVCFVYVGASAMDRVMTKRNIIGFIVYSVLICGCLALMNDFGAALIFFMAFLVIAYMRSGSVGTLGMACTALGFAGVVALKFAPHALQRFSSWRRIWEDPLGAGYQQTRALMCIASGGILGLGAGRGRMKIYFAADSDVAIATLSEEWGMIVLIMVILCIIAMAIFAVRCAAVSRSSFYAIGACTAASVLVVQAILNALGTVDVVPLTGVTFPFLSNGGSGMIGAWGLIAFIKAADTRQNASFAVKMSREEMEDE